MCVIILKPAGVEAPNYEIFHACWETNPDGFGYAVADGKSVTLSKGYMNSAAAWGAVHNIPTELSAILHFRIGTSGKNDGPTCHPYPVSNIDDELRATELEGLPMAVAHNGVIGKGQGLLNDTQLWVKHKLSTLHKEEGGFNLVTAQLILDLSAEAYSSRFSLLLASGEILRSGKWHEYLKTGLLFSNTSWEWSMYDRGYSSKRGSLGGYGKRPTAVDWWWGTEEEKPFDSTKSLNELVQEVAPDDGPTNIRTYDDDDDYNYRRDDGVEYEYENNYDYYEDLYASGFVPIDEDEYEVNLMDGITPPCPVCGGDVLPFNDSYQHICECPHCDAVFDGARGTLYIKNDIEHQLKRAAEKLKGDTTEWQQAAYVEK